MTIAGTDVKFFLSGGAANADPDASLGGAMSSVEVDLDTLLNNMFDNVTGSEATSGVTRYRCVYMQNTSADVNGLIDPVAWVDRQPQAAEDPYTVSGETLGFGFGVKNTVVDELEDENTAPDGIDFYTVDTAETAEALPSPDYTEDDYVAIYLRIVTPSSQAQAVGTEFGICIRSQIIPTA